MTGVLPGVRRLGGCWRGGRCEVIALVLAVQAPVTGRVRQPWGYLYLLLLE